MVTKDSMSDFIAIGGVVLVVIAFAAIITWLYRPNRSKICDEYGKILFKNDLK